MRQSGSRVVIWRIGASAAGPNDFGGERDATEGEESLELRHRFR
jgi:hypothetical protein